MKQLQEGAIGPVVETTAGRLRGIAGDGFATFLGIPFAAPLVGRNRFLEPIPVEPWKGVREATAYGPTAPQPQRGSTLIPEPTEEGDAFLNLNVFAPSGARTSYPVLVWIHGGGFFAGCNRSPWYDGRSFARAGIVVVSISYRLGTLGFMPLEGAPNNRAVLDWIAGLKWVRQNVAAFGGDPNRVTIAGQSAGGASVATLLAVPAAKGLFQQAIMMSGLSFPGSPDRTLGYARDFSRTVGLPATFDALGDMPTEQIIAAQVAAGGPPLEEQGPERLVPNFIAGLPLQPLAGTEILPDAPLTAILAGASAEIPILMSVTANEFNFSIAGDGRVSEGVARLGLGAMGLAADQIQEFWEACVEMTTPQKLGQAMTDKAFKVPMMAVAESRLTAGADAFVSEFRSPSRSKELTLFGACHCIDIPFAFNRLDAEGVERVTGESPSQTLADEVHRSWIAFIRSGKTLWKPYSSDRNYHIHGNCAYAPTLEDVIDIWL